MAKVGISAQLAKQAQAEAQAMAGAGKGQAAGGRSATGFGAWTVPMLPDGFDLTAALGEATSHVLSHYQSVLTHEGLRVAQVQQGGSQPMEETGIQVTEGETGRVMRMYTATDFLKMYAAQRQTAGVVVDGQV